MGDACAPFGVTKDAVLATATNDLATIFEAPSIARQ